MWNLEALLICELINPQKDRSNFVCIRNISYATIITTLKPSVLHRTELEKYRLEASVNNDGLCCARHCSVGQSLELVPPNTSSAVSVIPGVSVHTPPCHSHCVFPSPNPSSSLPVTTAVFHESPSISSVSSAFPFLHFLLFVALCPCSLPHSSPSFNFNFARSAASVSTAAVFCASPFGVRFAVYSLPLVEKHSFYFYIFRVFTKKMLRGWESWLSG